MMPKPVALTMGEPAGISAEITLKAWAALTQSPTAAPIQPAEAGCFFVIDDPVRLARTARDLSFDIPVSTISDPAEALEIFTTALPVLPLESSMLQQLSEVTQGTPSPKSAGAVMASIQQGVDLCLNGAVAGLVTNPVQKEALMQAGFAHPGHTEYLGMLTKEAPMPQEFDRGPVMMLAAADFKVTPLTTHIPVSQIANTLKRDAIIRTSHIVAQSLIRDFGFANPRLALCGLNPHAGEGGMIGSEEINIISPAIASLQKSGLTAMGPIPADSMFHDDARKMYDAAIAMYHDQALIPIKTAHFFTAVNITLGLPVIRTSPDHGTGLNIVGKGIARADSLINALVAARRISMTRTSFDAARNA